MLTEAAEPNLKIQSVCIIKLCSLEDVEGTNNKGAEEEERELYN
jgi:hypothetical protein